MEKGSKARPTAADYIYEALVQLMEQTPYDRITITDIVKKAGVSRMAYYRNYKDKDDILISHYRKELSTAAVKITQGAEKEYWIDYVRRHSRNSIVDYLIQAGLYGRVLDITLKAVQDFYQINYGLDMTDEKTVFMTCQKLGVLLGYQIYRHNHLDGMTTDALAGHLMDLMDPGDFTGQQKDAVS